MDASGQGQAGGPARGPGISIAARLFVAVGLPAAALVIALGVFAWWGARGAVLESLTRELEATVTIGASTLNPVTARFLLPGDEDTRSYKRLQKRLKTIQEVTGSVRVVLVGEDEKVRGDAAGELPLFGTAPRVALDRTEFQKALAGHPSVGVPFEAADGRRLMAAYALVPEREEAVDLGEDEGEPGTRLVLALEAPAQTLDTLDEVASYLAAVCLLFVLLVLVLATVVARTITGPVLKLADEATRLAERGLKEPIFVPAGRDEVARLGQTLEDMRRALLSRDEEQQMMLAGIAHEVRNPLGGMELFSGLLEEEIEALPTAAGDAPGPGVPAEVRDELASHAGRVRKELRYLTGVVNDFLAYARETQVAREEVPVAALLEDVRSLKHREGMARIEVRCDALGTFPLDRGRIKEALLNLVENAQQATPPGGTVTLAARLDDRALLLEVRDTGKGIPAETLERVFQPFFTTREKGSGLGLPLVQKFARDHGGDAIVESEPGQGTVVRLRLAWAAPASGRSRSGAEEASGRLRDPEPALLSDEGAPVGEPDEPALLGDGDDGAEDEEEPALLGDG